ncbi:hypothetical protein K439DRAFT_697973 [Ramaria rubella]|nr:hypothetical protein K439DRAFT_697973 [Ramaria rubella]
MPPSPTSPGLAFPGTPPPRDTPNVHPYAIKTSSSAVLTRSNSAGHRYYVNHHYTPVSPIKSPIGSKQSRYVPVRRYAKSLSTDTAPMVSSPVPMPPSSSPPARLVNLGQSMEIVSDGEGIPTPPLTLRVKRRDTLPSMFPKGKASLQDLPNNPKTWNPTQLSAYLSSALRLKGGAKLPIPVMRDIASFVMKEHLSGRTFLKMKREDYDSLGINQLWKDALLEASRTLRQNAVQGRIMGFESEPQLSLLTHEEEEQDTVSSDLPAYTPLDLTRRRAPLQWEEDRKRMSRTSFRAGRVRGMVETYERSCSESSGSGSECDGEDVSKSLFNDQVLGEPAEDAGMLGSAETSASDDEMKAELNTTLSAVGNTMFSEAGHEDPPIEELLRDSAPKENQHSWGAKAWEDEVNDPMGVHATARRVPFEVPPTVRKVVMEESDQSTAHRVSSVGGGSLSRNKGLAELFSELTIQDSVPPSSQLVHAEERSKALSELLAEYQKRLEVLEDRLQNMERMDKEYEREQERERLPLQQAQSNVQTKQTQQAHEEERKVEVCPPPEMVRPQNEDMCSKVKNYTGEDPSIAGLPGYMFLISLGVVAITMRVVLRRVLCGRRRIT